MSPLLEIDSLRVTFTTRRGVVEAVRNASFSVSPGETLGIVGESGSGKSVTAHAAMGLIDVPGEIVGGDIRWKGESLLANDRLWKRVRGKELSIVFQDPMTSLNPLFTVGMQLTEVMRHHLGMSQPQAMARAEELLELVGISAPARRLRQFAHEMSGGMRQRVMIAMALATNPELIIADEPTTALDVTIQAQILDLLGDLQQRFKLAIVVITHDLGVVARLCHRVAIMYGGKIVEEGPAAEVFKRPAHPYSGDLLKSTPRIDQRLDRLISIEGAPPDLLDPPPGCPYEPRCALAVDACLEPPALAPFGRNRTVACWRAGEAQDSMDDAEERRERYAAR